MTKVKIKIDITKFFFKKVPFSLYVSIGKKIILNFFALRFGF